MYKFMFTEGLICIYCTRLSFVLQVLHNYIIKSIIRIEVTRLERVLEPVRGL